MTIYSDLLSCLSHNQPRNRYNHLFVIIGIARRVYELSLLRAIWPPAS